MQLRLVLDTLSPCLYFLSPRTACAFHHLVYTFALDQPACVWCLLPLSVFKEDAVLSRHGCVSVPRVAGSPCDIGAQMSLGLDGCRQPVRLSSLQYALLSSSAHYSMWRLNSSALQRHGWMQAWLAGLQHMRTERRQCLLTMVCFSCRLDSC